MRTQPQQQKLPAALYYILMYIEITVKMQIFHVSVFYTIYVCTLFLSHQHSVKEVHKQLVSDVC